MKKYLTKIILFFIAIAMFDFLFGLACQYMNDHSKGGGIKSRYYVCKESSEDVLIFGSSRAKHHYVPDIIEDSLGMTCYNTGEDGNGIILSFGYLKMIIRRYAPKLIIYDVSNFDIYKDDNTKYLDLLKPYYYEQGIDSIFWAVNPKSRYMMLSNLYRFNSTCLRIIGGYFHPTADSHKGYSPLYKTMDYEIDALVPRQMDVDSLKISFFEEFIQLADKTGTKLICSVSPIYKGTDENTYNSIKNLCLEYGVPFLYFGSDSEITTQKEFFQDVTHLNDIGACFFTEKIVNMINND